MKMKVVEFENACPICNGTVKGNEEVKYFCKSCNLLFRKEQLYRKTMNKENEKKDVVQEQKMSSKQSGNFIASKESNKIHASNCFFASKIKKENRLYFDTLEEAKDHGFGKCVCLKKK